jgi:hypothetical protein
MASRIGKVDECIKCISVHTLYRLLHWYITLWYSNEIHACTYHTLHVHVEGTTVYSMHICVN